MDVMYGMQGGRQPGGPHIIVKALNTGPLPNRIGIVIVRKSWWQRRIHPTEAFSFIYPDYAHVATTQASTRLEVGDTGIFVFPYNNDCFLKDDFVRIGVTDGYGRTHWAPRTQLHEARREYRKQFIDGQNIN